MTHLQENCPDNELVIIKKGFSGYKSVTTFLGLLVLSALILWMVISSENEKAAIDASVDAITHLGNPPTSYLITNSILVSVMSIGCFLGLFAGTIDMNKLFTVCTKCGKITELKTPLENESQEKTSDLEGN